MDINEVFMNVLTVNYSETTCPGGINKAVRETALNLVKLGHEITIIQNNPSNLPQEELIDHYRIIRVNSRFGKYLYDFSYEIYFFLKNHLNQLNPDIIHIHGYHSLFSFIVFFSLRRLNPEIPIIFSAHLDTVRSTFAGKYLWTAYNFFGKNIFQKCSHIVSFSEYERSEIIKTFQVDPGKISIIPHGVDYINPQEKNKEKKIKLLYYGHLIKRKGINYILDALNVLIHDFGEEDVVLTIIGEGPELVNLKHFTEDKELENHIIWKPFLTQENLIKETYNSDIYLNLSNSEAYGISVAENLVIGNPCIVTKITALKEFLDEPGCFGVDYPPDPREVADLIIKIHKNKVKVGPFSAKIRTWNDVSLEYEKLYKEILEGN